MLIRAVRPEGQEGVFLCKQFGEHFERYLLIRRARNISESTLRNEKKQHRLFWKFLESCQFQGDELSVRRKEIEQYALDVNSNTETKANTKRTRLSYLKYFYREAERQGWIAFDPAESLELPKVERPAIRILKVQEMKTLLATPELDTVVGIRDRTIMEVMYSSALRRSEVLSLKEDSFADDFRTVKVNGKGGKEAVVPVGKMAAHFLKFYCDTVRLRIARETKLLFVGVNDGSGLSSVSLEKIIRDRSQQAGLSKVTPHCFRYSVCTHLVEEGVDIRLIQEFMRHESIDTTARYIKHAFEHLQEVHRKTHPTA